MKKPKFSTLKLHAFVALCTALGFPVSVNLRFIPKDQKRRDDRGRTISTYEFYGDALKDLHDIYNGTLISKEPEHGTYYLSVEIRSQSVEKLGAGRKNKDTVTVPLPLQIPEELPGQATTEPDAAHTAQAAYDDAIGDYKYGNVHQPDHRSYSDAGPGEPVEENRVGKVDLSKIGVR